MGPVEVRSSVELDSDLILSQIFLKQLGNIGFSQDKEKTTNLDCKNSIHIYHMLL